MLTGSDSEVKWGLSSFEGSLCKITCAINQVITYESLHCRQYRVAH